MTIGDPEDPGIPLHRDTDDLFFFEGNAI